MQDPRSKNESIQAKSITEYLDFYADAVSKALASVSKTELERSEKMLLKVIEEGKRVYTAGNGGSAAIGDHLCCDWMKGTYVPGLKPLRVQALASNTAILTALGNDYGYEHSFSSQIEMMGEEGDCVVLISSSGNSPNIIAAAEMAKRKNMKIIGMTGFSGGKLKELSDVSLHVSVNNYGIAEDAHQSLMHILTHRLNYIRDPR